MIANPLVEQVVAERRHVELGRDFGAPKDRIALAISDLNQRPRGAAGSNEKPEVLDDCDYSAGAASPTADGVFAGPWEAFISARWRRWRSQTRMPVTPSTAGMMPLRNTTKRQTSPE